MVVRLAKETGAQGKVHYEVGTMIEVPRACLAANELAAEADFMSFGTNDLTQMTCGFSRDDSGVFLREYVKKGIYKRDPFQSIDQEGVGRMMMLCVALARSTKPNIDIGLCGEHGGDPTSVEFCHRIGLDNVSCSPYRVPVARLAAAHNAALAAEAEAAHAEQRAREVEAQAACCAKRLEDVAMSHAAAKAKRAAELAALSASASNRDENAGGARVGANY